MLEYLFYVAFALVETWAADPKPFCYAGLFALYLAEFLGAHCRGIYGVGALMYLALYLV